LQNKKTSTESVSFTVEVRWEGRLFSSAGSRKRDGATAEDDGYYEHYTNGHQPTHRLPKTWFSEFLLQDDTLLICILQAE
jgi:hypothetical protein